MKRYPTSPALVLATAGAAALIVAANASAATKSNDTMALKLTAVQTSFVPVPAISKSAPPQIGTRMFFENALYNRGAAFGKPAGARIGTAEVLCTIASKAALECVITAHLPGGELVLTGSNPLSSKHSSYAVTGGVGIFSNVRGSATGTNLSPTRTAVDGTLSL